MLERDASWLISGLHCTCNAFPKTVVYARSINCVTDVYAWLLENWQQDAYVNDQRMVAMYHAHLSEDMLHSTMADFKKPDLTVRVVVSTVAFGVGIKIPDIRQVVHNWRQCLIRLPCIFTALVYAEKTTFVTQRIRQNTPSGDPKHKNNFWGGGTDPSQGLPWWGGGHPLFGVFVHCKVATYTYLLHSQ